jgi:acyl carrier protein
MIESKILEILQNIFRDLFDEENLILTRDTSSKNIEDWDSVAQISLILTIENTYNIRISAAEIENLSNVGDIVDLLCSKLN